MKLYRTSWLKRIAAGTFTAMHLLLHFLSIRTWLFQPAAARPILRASSHPNRGGRIRWGELLSLFALHRYLHLYVGGAVRTALGRSPYWLGPEPEYRVRAPNARSHRSPAPPLQAHFKSEAIEPHTIVIIIRFFGGVFYRVMRLLLPIQFIYIVWRFGRCGLCECGQLEEALQALGDYAHPHHDAQTSV